jgi:hypothetical protein
VCRGAIKLYSDFLQSDIIVASPLALTTVLAEPPPEGGGAPGDFLSAIEIAVVDRADVLLMQNWAHVVTGESFFLQKLLPCQLGKSQIGGEVETRFLRFTPAGDLSTVRMRRFMESELR